MVKRSIVSGYDVSLFDTHTAQKITALLKEDTPISQKLKNLLISKPSLKLQQTNLVSTILDHVYRQDYNHKYNYNHYVYPEWIARFISTPNLKKSDKIKFVKNFGNILTFSHTILKLTEKSTINDEITLKDKYLSKWKKERIIFFKNLDVVGINPQLETNIENLLQLKITQNSTTTTTTDLKKLIKIRQEYNNVIKNKFKPPELKIIIDPNEFGNPPNAERLFNMMVSKLTKLQNYFIKYPPISQKDLNELDTIDLNSLSGYVREGYVEYLTNSVFIINDNAEIKKSNILEKRVAISNKIETLYKNFN
ncbi:hypothetical protein C6P40_000668 [Pichia californica]|uniref:Uncharacterized protein n=1 Tax=Pichia californica TaxID=460514 RepID=A0A9P6WK80_9ASCO|nr:hypothetical protein C6P40_000668 [[Candida] californica]